VSEVADVACVLDASALLAILQGESGGTALQGMLDKAALSSVNWSEVVQKALDRDIEVDDLRREVEALGVRIVPFSADHAEQAAFLRAATRHLGLSLGDRSCLALAKDLKVPAMTTDKAWKELGIGVEIRIAR
jgi:PIN domain nuclease of toxin-antitoxin system